MKCLKPLILASLGAFALASLCPAAILKFGGPINGAQATTDSSAIGASILILDTEVNTFDLSINISGLTNDLTLSHIHAAPAGLNGPVIVDIGDMSVYDVVGDFYRYQVEDVPFPPEELVNLLADNTYLNFHTSVFEAGEVRGQLVPMSIDNDALVNMSTRGMLNPGNGKAGLLIGGLVLQERKTILFRMVADSLTRFGVQTGLKDTSFEIFKLNSGELATAELIGENDNWKEEGQRFQIASTGFAPGFDNESALILTLDPGSYTLNADSEQGAGIALVETYGIEPKSIGESISAAANGSLNQAFAILNAVVAAIGLNELLDDPGPFTLFAPTDEAFLSAFTQEELDELMADDADMSDDLDTLTAILMSHVVGGSILSTDLTDGVAIMVSALSGSELSVLLSGEVVTVKNATVIEGDLDSTNGVIHVIDAIIE